VFTNDIIFQLKEGASLEKFEELFASHHLKARMLHNIDCLIDLDETDAQQKEKIFWEKYYPQMSELEQKLFRTYVITDLAERKSVGTLAMLREYIAHDNNSILSYVQPSFVYQADHDAETDTEDDSNWGVGALRCQDAWAEGGNQGEGIIVAVVDTGVDYTHERLKDNMWCHKKNGEIVHGFDFVIGNWKPLDTDNHGSHCAGIIAGMEKDQIMIGIAPKAKIMALKIMDSAKRVGHKHTSDTSLCSQAIYFAVRRGAHVISNSWSGTEDDGGGQDTALLEAIDHAYHKGCVMVFAAGNTGLDVSCEFPANNPKLITVAGTDKNDLRVADSSWGSAVTLAAPGYLILSVTANTTFKLHPASGTSTACPHVAGLAALLLGINRRISPKTPLSPDRVKEIMVRAGFNLPRPAGYHPIGKGKRAQALCSVKELLGRSLRGCWK
jgi:subtilisin family serine protease